MDPLYHTITKRQLDAITAGSASYIFAGDRGSGRFLAALDLAKRLNCANAGNDDCLNCINIASTSFPDLHVIEAPGMVGIEHVQELQQTLAQRPFSSTTSRVVIIDATSGITRESQNRLLKTLEEPPAQTIIILLSGSPEVFLPTVVSRCR